MLTHSKVWNAIDALARRYGLSASGLAKRAGLDATAFNRSKRVTGEGCPRWPTTDSIAKVLDATGASLEDFVALVRAETPGRRKLAQPIPLTNHSGSTHVPSRRGGDAPRRQPKNQKARALRSSRLWESLAGDQATDSKTPVGGPAFASGESFMEYRRVLSRRYPLPRGSDSPACRSSCSADPR